MGLVKVQGQMTQNKLELNAFIATPPNVDQNVLLVQKAAGGSNGIISVQGYSPNESAKEFEYKFDAGAFAATSSTTTLAAGAHTVQARDKDTPANVSTVLTFTV